MAKGDLTFNSDGTYSFNPNGEFEALSTGDSEQVTFTYQAVDNDGAQSAAKTVTITVNGVNDAPVADGRGTSRPTRTRCSPARCDTSDIDGTVVSHALVSGVAKGSLTFLQDGSWSFDPDGDFDDLDAGESEQVTLHLPRHRQ